MPAFSAYLKQVCGCVQNWTDVLRNAKNVFSIQHGRRQIGPAENSAYPIFLVAQFWPTKRIPHMCGKQPPYFIPRTERGFSRVFPFRASKISRYSLKYWGLLGMTCQPLPSFAHRRWTNRSPHSQLVAKRVSPRRLFLFTSENNANICNHGSAHLPKGFPVKTTQTVLFAIGGEAGNSEKTGTAIGRTSTGWKAILLHCVTMTIEFSQAGGLRRRRPEKGSMARLKEAWVNAHYFPGEEKRGHPFVGCLLLLCCRKCRISVSQKSGEIVIYRLDFPKILGNLLYVSGRLLGH